MLLKFYHNISACTVPTVLQLYKINVLVPVPVPTVPYHLINVLYTFLFFSRYSVVVLGWESNPIRGPRLGHEKMSERDQEKNL